MGRKHNAHDRLHLCLTHVVQSLQWQSTARGFLPMVEQCIVFLKKTIEPKKLVDVVRCMFHICSDVFFSTVSGFRRANGVRVVLGDGWFGAVLRSAFICYLRLIDTRVVSYFEQAQYLGSRHSLSPPTPMRQAQWLR